MRVNASRSETNSSQQIAPETSKKNVFLGGGNKFKGGKLHVFGPCCSCRDVCGDAFSTRLLLLLAVAVE